MWFKNRKAQSTTEYAIILAVVAAALVAMQVYVKRGIQGRIRDLADQISPVQYEQGQTESEFTTTQTGSTTSSYTNGQTRTEILEDEPEEIIRHGWEETEPETDEVGG